MPPRPRASPTCGVHRPIRVRSPAISQTASRSVPALDDGQPEHVRVEALGRLEVDDLEDQLAHACDSERHVIRA